LHLPIRRISRDQGGANRFIVVRSALVRLAFSFFEYADNRSSGKTIIGASRMFFHYAQFAYGRQV
jgi:hypothetical protein